MVENPAKVEVPESQLYVIPISIGFESEPQKTEERIRMRDQYIEAVNVHFKDKGINAKVKPHELDAKIIVYDPRQKNIATQLAKDEFFVISDILRYRESACYISRA